MKRFDWLKRFTVEFKLTNQRALFKEHGTKKERYLLLQSLLLQSLIGQFKFNCKTLKPIKTLHYKQRVGALDSAGIKNK